MDVGLANIDVTCGLSLSGPDRLAEDCQIVQVAKFQIYRPGAVLM